MKIEDIIGLTDKYHLVTISDDENIWEDFAKDIIKGFTQPGHEWRLAPFTEGVIQAAMRSAAEMVRKENNKLANNLIKQAMFIDIMFGVDGE